MSKAVAGKCAVVDRGEAEAEMKELLGTGDVRDRDDDLLQPDNRGIGALTRTSQCEERNRPSQSRKTAAEHKIPYLAVGTSAGSDEECSWERASRPTGR
ncbi:MAG TPA: hypothetical protein VGV37_29020 [Aliidongia sp.]|uniref:hypothetical protein n=1 Tax=Aliidongia sp. TaxID=1914230 RepID=UPI002DDD3BE7|nr:hypothetical protein [Aliidongia sp.]HEV2678604.1 hypothetical protein [Aliidongia sp.]